MLAEKTAVVWRRPGGAFTIQCRYSEQEKVSLNLKRGIKKSDVLFMNLEDQTIKKEFRDRLQINGVFPNLDILIKNLTSNDTGPYWCFYIKTEENDIPEEEGKGSVLLVVSGEPKSSMP